MNFDIIKRFPLDGIIQVTLDEEDYLDEYKQEYKFIIEKSIRGIKKDSLSPKKLQSICGENFLQKVCIKVLKTKVDDFLKNNFKDQDLLPTQLIDFQTSVSKDFFHPGKVSMKYFYGLLATDKINDIDDKIKNICIDTMFVNDMDDKYLTDVLYDKVIYNFFNMKFVNKVEYENDLLTLENLHNGNILRIFAKISDSISYVGKSLYDYIEIDKSTICDINSNIKSLTDLDKCLLLSSLNDGKNVFKISAIYRIMDNKYKNYKMIKRNDEKTNNESKKNYYELLKDKSINIFNELTEEQRTKVNYDFNEIIDYYNSINKEILNKINRNNLIIALLKVFVPDIPSEYLEIKISQFANLYSNSDIKFYRIFLTNMIKWETVKKALIKHYNIVIDDMDEKWTKKLINLENTKLYNDVIQALRECNKFPFLDRLNFNTKFLFNEIKLLAFLIDKKIKSNSRIFNVEEFYKYIYDMIKSH